MGAQPPLSSHAHFPLPPSTIPFHPAHLVPTCAETSTQRPGPTSPSASEKRRSSDLDHWPVPVPVLGLGPGLALLVCLGLLVCLVVFSVAGDMAVRCGAVRCGAVRGGGGGGGGGGGLNLRRRSCGVPEKKCHGCGCETARGCDG